jgi:membrane protein required for colicin V production
MTSFDYAIIAIVAVSVILGMWRGMAYEAMSLAGWIAAYLVARLYAAEVMRYLPQAIEGDEAKTTVAYALLFVLTLILSALVAWLTSKLVKSAGMGVSDASLGGLFGLVRGVMIVLVLVWLAGMTELPKKLFWRDAWLSKPLQKSALYLKNCLPDKVAKNLVY